MTTASAPKQPIPGGLSTPGTLAYVITAKYCDALPLYRQSAIMARMEIDLSRRTLNHWMVRSAERLEALYQQLRQRLLREPILHADETGVQVLNEPERGPKPFLHVAIPIGAGESSSHCALRLPARSRLGLSAGVPDRVRRPPARRWLCRL